MNDLKICSALFDLIDDEQQRFENPILYSKHSVERLGSDFILLRRTAWFVNKSDEFTFKAISAADHITVENWLLKLTDGEFQEASRAVSEHDNDSLITLISSLDEPETNVVGLDLDSLSKAISGYNQLYSSPDIGREIIEWFGDEAVDLSSFPTIIHPMLTSSIEQFQSEEAQRDADRRRMRLEFDLTAPELGIRLTPGLCAVETMDSLGKGLVANYGARRSAGSSDFLKMRAFAIRVDQMKSDGYRVIDLQGIFAGEQTRTNLCYGLVNVSEPEAIELIEKTEIRVGLYVDPHGICKIIDLDA